jgi:hypothetical protein
MIAAVGDILEIVCGCPVGTARLLKSSPSPGLPLSLRRCNARTMRPRPQVRRDDDDVGTRQSTGLKRAPSSWRPRIEQPSVRRARVAGLPPQLQPRAFQFDHAWPLTPVTLLGAAMVGRLPLIWIDVQFQIPRTFGCGRPFLSGQPGPKRRS